MHSIAIRELRNNPSLQAWCNGDISLGKMAELLKMDKRDLRHLLSLMNLPMIDYPADEVSAEIDFLLQDATT